MLPAAALQIKQVSAMIWPGSLVYQMYHARSTGARRLSYGQYFVWIGIWLLFKIQTAFGSNLALCRWPFKRRLPVCWWNRWTAALIFWRRAVAFLAWPAAAFQYFEIPVKKSSDFDIRSKDEGRNIFIAGQLIHHVNEWEYISLSSFNDDSGELRTGALNEAPQAQFCGFRANILSKATRHHRKRGKYIVDIV